MAADPTLEERLRALVTRQRGDSARPYPDRQWLDVAHAAAAEALEEAARKIEERLGNTSAGFVADELRQLARELREGKP